jgi:hypothetical protein
MVLGAISASTNALYTDTFTGDGTETDYTLGITPVDLNAIEVYLNGLYQNVGTLTLAANVVTFATAPPSGVIIEIRSVGFLNSGGTLAPATLTGGTGISVVTNSPNNFTISNTLGAGIDWNTTIRTATFSADTGKGYIVNTTSSEVTVNLPAGIPGSIVAIQDYAGTFDNNKLIISSNGSEAIQGSTTVDGQCVVENATVYLLYQDSTQGWTSQDISLIPQDTTVNYLVVAGGGGGAGGTGSTGGGGGGAGGYRTNYNGTALTLSLATPYLVTIGSGGNGGPASSTLASNGNDSVFHNITSTKGGGGSAYSSGTAGSGGSGGGGSYYSSGSPVSDKGLGNTPSTTPSQGNNGGIGENSASNGGGGGGGASSVGAAASNGGGNGGTGTSNSITGSALFYAGGGGGGSSTGSYSGGAGGSSVGGDGTIFATGGNATANRGGGGGGAGTPYVGGNGGSGIVVLKYPNTKTITIPGTLTATTTTVSTDKVTTFTAGTGNIQFN